MSFSDNLILSGEFVASLVENDTLQHCSGLMRYNIESDSYSQFYGGGVYSSYAHKSDLEALYSTPL